MMTKEQVELLSEDEVATVLKEEGCTLEYAVWALKVWCSYRVTEDVSMSTLFNDFLAKHQDLEPMRRKWRSEEAVRRLNDFSYLKERREANRERNEKLREEESEHESQEEGI